MGNPVRLVVFRFAELPKNCNGPIARWRVNRFNQICGSHGIEPRLTKT
jgi:hypothetical protein